MAIQNLSLSTNDTVLATQKDVDSIKNIARNIHEQLHSAQNGV